MPPIEASAPGSIGKNRPLSRKWEFSALRVMPGSTTQSRSSAWTASTRSIRDRSMRQAAVQRVEVAFERAAGAIGDDRRVVARADRHRLHHVLAALGEQHGVRRRVRRPGQGMAVLDARRLGGRDLVAEMGVEVGDQRGDGLGGQFAFAPTDDCGSCVVHAFVPTYRSALPRTILIPTSAAAQCGRGTCQRNAICRTLLKILFWRPGRGPFATPPFSLFKPEHFRPAFDAALAERRAEIEAIKTNPEPPTFENTIVAMERAGKTLGNVARVFFHLASADTNEALEAIERDIAPILSRESNAIFLDDALFKRVDWVKAGAMAAGLDAEARRLVERYHTAFVRSGAGLDADAQAAARRDRRAAGDARHRVRAERAGRRARISAAARERGGACRAVAGFPRRRQGDGGGARRAGQIRDHAVALVGRAVLAVLHPSRSARKSLARLRCARRQRRRARQWRDHGRDADAAGRDGVADRLCQLRRLQALRHDGEDAGRRATG